MRSLARATRLICLSCALTCSLLFAQSANRNSPPHPDRLVVVGDSLSAGVQNFSLLFYQQPNGYASIIARQGGWNLSLPFVPYPGIPNVLQLKSVGPPPDIEPAQGQVPFFRLNPFTQPNNVSVPGATLASALTLRPDVSSTNPEQIWATTVLGFPSLFQGNAPTEIELAQSLKPNTMIEWLGNNDALVPAVVGVVAALTPPLQFDSLYQQILTQLSQTGAKLITATVPDVTEVAYFATPQAIANQYKQQSVNDVMESLGIGPNDYVLPGAQLYVDEIFTGQRPGPLPPDCPAPLPDLGVSTVPCVLRAADAQTIRNTVACYNESITHYTEQSGGLLVDIHALVDRIYENGYPVGRSTLTTDFFGGLFSLDGLHPTNTGYGIIANEFITKMNPFLGKQMSPVNIGLLFALDPLRRYATPNFTPRSVPSSSCPVPLPWQSAAQ